MKTIKKRLKFISFLMSFLILFVSCNQYDDSSLEKVESVKYSGEDIFKGLFFFQNEIPNGITHLKEINTKIKKMNQENTEMLVSLNELSEISTSYINEKYPNFFKELQLKMYSGNLFEIEKSLNTSVKMIEQAVLTSEKYSSAFLIGKKINQDKKLMDKIINIDLSTISGQKELKLLLSSVDGFEGVDEKAIFFAAVAAVAYIVAAAVSFVVAAYSVITKVAYWDTTKLTEEKLFSETKTLGREIIIADIGDFFINNR